MKTTEAPARGHAPLVAAALVTVVLGGVFAGVGAVVDGSAAAYGALIGTAIAAGVFAFGAFAVDAVARVMPVASLLVALMTYTVQVLLMALLFVVLDRSGLLDSTVDRGWLGGAIIIGALAWSIAQIRATTKARIPAFEQPFERPVNGADEARVPAAEGGSR